MEIDYNIKKKITDLLLSISDLEGLVIVLNEIQDWIKSQNPQYKFENKRITEQNLKYILYSKKTKYNTFEIAKKSGGVRTITAPNTMVKYVQSLLNIALQCYFTPYPSTSGFVRGRSIVSNALRHTNKKYVYNIDLEDFFPSITYGRVKAVLEKVAFVKTTNWMFASTPEVIKTPNTVNPKIAHYIANICCNHGVLPQGAPTSPVISNMVCKILDYRLYKFAIKNGLIYSRYADDITFSSNKPLFTEETKKEIFEIIKGQGFKLNQQKERLQVYGFDNHGVLHRDRQIVTGIVVNKRTNLTKTYIRNLRAAIHNWETKGYLAASKLHELHYVHEKGFLKYKGVIPKMELVIGGRLEFLGMVRGKKDSVYRTLKLRFDQLCKSQKLDEDYLKEILDIWDRHGLNKAINRFYNRQKNIGE